MVLPFYRHYSMPPAQLAPDGGYGWFVVLGRLRILWIWVISCISKSSAQKKDTTFRNAGYLDVVFANM